MATIRYDVKENNKRLKDGYRMFPAVVTYQKDGKQKRKTFKCAKQAKKFYDGLIATMKSYGDAFWALKPADADLAYRAWERANKNGYDLMTALGFYEAQTTLSANPKLDDVFEKVIKVKLAESCSRLYKQHFEREITRFAKAFSGKRMDSITTQMVEKYVTDPEKNWGTTTKHYNKCLMSVFFNMCKKMKYCLGNPIEFAPKKQREKHSKTRYIDYVNATEAEIIMRVVEQKKPEHVVTFALILFEGLRTDTACRMHPRDISLEEGRMRVPDCIEKTYGRVVDITPNGLKWLKKYLPKAKLPIFGAGENFIPEKMAADDSGSGYERFEQWKEDCRSEFNTIRKYVQRHAVSFGGRWPKNGLRHAFCTHHMCLFNDAAKTSFKAGNSPKEIQDSYDGKVFSKSKAEEYFNILPV